MHNPALHGTNIIGSARSKQGSVTFTATDPSNGSALESSFHEATANEIDRAARSAADAFDANKAFDSQQRATLLEQIAAEIEVLDERLVDRVCSETGLGPARVRGERGRTTGQLRMFADLVREGSWVDARIDRSIPDRTPIPKPDIRRMLVALGPVAVFGASNFPLAFSVAGGDTAAALAAGCPVIVKAHPAHPGTSELVAEAIGRAVESCGFHPGTFSLLHGKSPETSLTLVRHPLVQAVAFTGSHRAGRAIFDAAAARAMPIPVFAEMGSVNPMFLLPGALSERGDTIAAGLANSVTLGAGQFCTNPGLVFGIKSEALIRFIESVAETLGDCEPFTLLHQGIRASYQEGVENLSRVQGVTVTEPPAVAPGRARATLLRTDINTFLREPALRKEVFGPSTVIVQCDDMKSMEEAARALEGNLTATIHGSDGDLLAAHPLVDILVRKVGRLIVNGFPTGVEVCPSMHHGGPYPASTDVRSTSVGTAAIHRFARPICYQDFPAKLLPTALNNRNELKIWRLVDGSMTKSDA